MPAYNDFEVSQQSQHVAISVTVGLPPQAPRNSSGRAKEHRLGSASQAPITVMAGPVPATFAQPPAAAVPAGPAAPAHAAATIPIAPLPASVKGYARFIVVALQPHLNAPEQPAHAPATFTVGLRHLVDTLGARRVLRQLTNNFFRQRRQHVQGNLCPHVHGFAPCACPDQTATNANTNPTAVGTDGAEAKPQTVRQRVHLEACADGFQCPFVHITPGGWSSRRRWKPFGERRGGTNGQPHGEEEQEQEQEDDQEEQEQERPEAHHQVVAADLDQDVDSDTTSVAGSEVPSLPSTPGTPQLGEPTPQLLPSRRVEFVTHQPYALSPGQPHYYPLPAAGRCRIATAEDEAQTKAKAPFLLEGKEGFDGEWQRFPGVFVSHKNPMKMQKLLAAESLAAEPTPVVAGRAPPLKSRTK